MDEKNSLIVLKALQDATGEVWEREYKFHPTRRWRADYACEALRIIVEVNGGNFVYGRHSNALALTKEYEKRANAAALGWVMIEVTPPTTKCEIMRFGSQMFWDIFNKIIELRRSKFNN